VGDERLGAIRLPILRLHLELTNRCNFSCEFCPDRVMSRPRGVMPLAMVAQILSQVGREGLARQAHFHVMGEPLLYPDLLEAVRLAGRAGLEAWITTNGSLLSPRLALELQAAGLRHLTISLQTPDAQSFELRGSRALSFDQYRESLIGTLRAYLEQGGGMALTLSFLANPLRRFHAPDAPRWRVAESAEELRAHVGRWVEAIVAGTPLEARRAELLRRLGTVGVLRERRIPLTDGLGVRVRILGNWAGHFQGRIAPARFGTCLGLAEHLGVLWNGDYVICCADYDGRTVLANAADTPLRDYLALPAVQAIAGGFRRCRVLHPHCRQCLGGRRPLSYLRQAGSIAYFGIYRRLLRGCQGERGAA
jgi:hypothetical protein